MSRIVIIGGGVMGSSTAYFLAMAGHAGDVTVIEPDPTYEFAATPRATGGVRVIFGVEENIRMSQFGHEVYSRFHDLMAVDGEPADIGYRRGGYMYLGTGRDDVKLLEENCAFQKGFGCDVYLRDRAGIKALFPSLHVDDLDIALHSPNDAFIDPYSVLMGFRRKAISLGVSYRKDRVIGLEASPRRVERVVLEGGDKLSPELVVNAANCWAPDICAMVGMGVPVKPLARMSFYYRVPTPLEPMPLTRHITMGGSFRPFDAGYLGGMTRYDQEPGFHWDLDDSLFDTAIWPDLAHRVPAFETLKMQRSWVGHYDWCYLDGNMVLGPWTGRLENFYIACGFSGHGLQHAPAVGRALKELLVDGGYQTIDLSRFDYRRVMTGIPVPDIGPKA